MKNIASLLMFALLLSSPVFARSHDVPLRYREQPRNLRHAGTIRHATHNTGMLNLNYKTGTGLNYRTGALCNYSTPSGLNYRTATSLRYR